jgi:HEAT repeat protein
MTYLLFIFFMFSVFTVSQGELKEPPVDKHSSLLQALQSGDVDARKTAAKNLAILLTMKQEESICDSTELIASSLADSESEVRVSIATILAGCASKSPTVAVIVLRHRTEILTDLSSSEASEREMMLNMLSLLGVPLPVDFQAAVLQLLHDPARKVRRAAIYAVLHFKPELSEAGPILDSLIERGDDDRAYAEIVLGLMKTGDPRSIQALARGLTDKEVFVRQEAVRALGRIGHPASTTVSQIKALESDPQSDPILRSLAKEALRAIN